MALNFYPKKRMILECDFHDFKEPEITKKRPVVVISCSRARPGLCIVVPISRTPPQKLEAWHHPFSRASSWDRQKRWAKCDMIYTVSYDRLDRWKKGRDRRTGKRIYLSNFYISQEDFESIKAGMSAALGLKI